VTRRSDWQSRLHNFIQANRNKPFQWGSWDCCLWVASAIQAMTDVDIAADWRGKYSSATEAAGVCQQVCGDASVGAMAAHVAGVEQMSETPVLHAQRGDMLLLDNPTAELGESLGLVSFNGYEAWAIATSGLVLVDIAAHAKRAWRVGSK
jgi:hypothetical protein